MSREPIAIIGIGCRFPGAARGLDEYWKVLSEGIDAIREIPADRWSIAAHYDPVPGRVGKSVTRWGGFVDEIDRFDAEFFGISPREAERVDPQQRMLLETAWEALEDAGQDAAELRGSPTGVFVGISTHDYELLQTSPDEPSDLDVYSTTGGTLSIAANRISYVLDFRGPSLAIDTACSSSLVALHAACLALERGDCGLALVGGVNALLSPTPFLAFSRMSMLSPTGRCRAFDAAADGFVRGEGAGVVVLKPLSAALAAGDRIHALVRGTAANQDGRTNGITVPSAVSQAALVRAACRVAGVDPASVVYAEAHGTGTQVGDPIEASALGEALGEGRSADHPLVVGSAKTNVGHLEAGAGIAGLVKLALVLSRGLVPPNLHFHEPNPAIDFERLKIRVPTELEELVAANGGAAIGCVNSFGFGGSNGHAVLEAPPRRPAASRRPARESERARLLALSARSPERLVEAVEAMRTFLADEEREDVALDDVAWTAGARRTHHDHRLAVVGSSRAELAERLTAFAAGEAPAGIVRGEPVAGAEAGVVFVFSGQGPQWWAMGRELLRREPVFRAKLEEVDAILAGFGGGWRLLDELARGQGDSRLAQTRIAQPAIFAHQVALAALLESWGVRPAATVGHSVGEVAAAHVAGALSLAQATRVIYERGRCMDLAPERGRMLAVRVTAEEAAEAIRDVSDRVAVGAINAPASVTLSGEGAALDVLARAFEARGVSCRFVPVEYAFHSPQMDPVEGELRRTLGDVARSVPVIPLISTVSGGASAPEDLDADYWWSNVRRTVRFAPAIDFLAARGARLFLELSAHPALAPSIAECLRASGVEGRVVTTLRRREPERATLLASLGALHAAGVALDWKALHPSARELASLPGTVWRKERYWNESRGSRERRLDPAEQPFLERDAKATLPTWEAFLDRRAMPALEDHRVQGHVLFPAAGFVEVALEVAARRFGAGPAVLEDVDLLRSLTLPDGEEPPRLAVRFEPADSRFAIETAVDESRSEWTRHAAGRLRSGADPGEHADLGRLRREIAAPVDVDECYRRFRLSGLEFGPAFRGINRLWRRDGEALGRVEATAGVRADRRRYRVHPALLDAAFQVLSAALPEPEPGEPPPLYLPVHVGRVRFHASPGDAVWSHARLTRRDGHAIVGEILVLDERGRVLVAIEGFRCQRVIKALGATSSDPASWLYESRFDPKPLAGDEPAHAGFLAGAARVAGVARDALAARQRGRSARERFLEVEPDLDRLCRGYVLAALDVLGWKPRVGQTVDAERLAASLRVVRRQRAAFARLVDLLAEDGILSGERGARRLRRRPRATELDVLWRSLLGRFPALEPELTLVRRAGVALPAILRGKEDAFAVLAPGGSFAALEHFYQDAPSAADYNHAVAAAIAAAVAAAPEGRVVRVLEIGAGTGGTTAHVLSHLRADRTEYVFSDVSPAFFARAEQKFFESPFLRCQLLDVERSPADQGFEPGSFDVVLAADALHATARLRPALRHARELLAPGGLLVLLEIDRPTRWIDLVFGLTPGWWRFRDRELRAAHPLLDREAWLEVLAGSGFAEVAAAGDVVAAERSGQSILVARTPGASPPHSAYGRSLPDGERRSPPLPIGERSAVKPPGEGETEAWLLFADRGGVGERLAETLAADGARVITAVAGAEPREKDDLRFELRPGIAEDLRWLLARAGSGLTRVVHLWSLDAPATEATTLDSLREAEAAGCHTVLHLVQALSADAAGEPPKLAIVTRGAHAVCGAGESLSPAQAPVSALGRVVQNEHRRLGCRMIDVDPAADVETTAAALARELRATDGEEEVAWRGGIRFANRLVRTTLERHVAPPPAGSPAALEVDAPGALTGLRLTARPRHRPAAGEVEIEVHAAALNFRDVMKALGIYPIESDRDLRIGDECAGRVVAVGRGVAHVREGDRVIAFDGGCFATHKTVPANVVARMPKGLFFEEAVTIPVAFLTSWYALHHLGRVRAGESVLVHAATGGVGLAALQIARLAGARLFATAGSPEKRELLRALGVEHVFDSRSLAFADGVRAATGGRGVDLVLNSLAGEAIEKSLDVLSTHGRFLEIGKRDIFGDTRIGLRPFQKGLSLFAIDMQKVMRDQPELVRRLVGDFLARFATGELRPLPYRSFPLSDHGAAFRLMAKAQHVGKIVLTTRDERARPRAPTERPAPRLAPDATFLVTGGLGGFGLALAEWMVAHGARSLVLTGRRGAATPEARAVLARLRRAGAKVVVARADAADPRATARLFARIDRTLPPLRGVVHAAMVLDDGLLAELDPERFRRVMAPKVEGAWNLHVATRDRALDFFVLFSSVSAIVGAPAQANYVAANAFLIALAHHRRTLGLPALAVDWGGLSEVGYVARHERVEEHLTRQGILGIPPADALRLFGEFLGGDSAEVGVVRVDWQKWAGFLPAVSTAPRFSELFHAAATDGTTVGTAVRETILDAPPEERAALVVTHLRDQVARVLRTAAAKLDVARPLGELGVDSLMGFELVNQLESQFQIAIPPAKLGAGATIERIAEVILDVLTSAGEGGGARGGAAALAEPERVVVLRPGAGRAPLFCFHPAGGRIEIYRDLAASLPPDLPVLALPSRALGEAVGEHASIEALAGDHAARIAEYAPGVPVRLAGFSLGGLFALATARALRERGVSVGLVALIDSDLQLASPDRRDDDYVRRHVEDMYRTFARELGAVQRLDGDALAGESTELARRIVRAAPGARSRTIVDWIGERGHLLAGISPTLLERYFALFETHLDLVEGFRPAPSPVPLAVWRSTQRGEAVAVGAGTVLVDVAIDASHYELMYPPHAGRIAEELDRVLRHLESGAAHRSNGARPRAEHDGGRAGRNGAQRPDDERPLRAGGPAAEIKDR